MASISVCVLTNKDPENLVRVLTPLSSFADEILIGDMQNSAEVKARAKEFNAIIVHLPKNLIEAKNTLLKKASKEYTFFLHSSEVIFKHKLPKLKAFLDQDQADAYVFTVKQYTTQKNILGWKPSSEFQGFTGFVSSKQVLLWKTNPDLEFSGILSGSIIPWITKNKKMMKEITDIPVHQLGNSFQGIIKQQAEAALKESPHDEGLLYRLGKMYLLDNAVEQAEECFEKIKNRNFKNTALNLANVYLVQGKNFKAAQVYRDIIEKDENNAGAYHNLGILFRKSGKLDKAEWCFRKALAINKEDARLYKILAITYEQQGNTDKAKTILALGIKATNDPELAELLKTF